MSKLEDIVFEILVDHGLNTDQKGEAISEYFTDLLEKLRDTSDCEFDHHGYCQAHGWMEASECPQAEIKGLLA